MGTLNGGPNLVLDGLVLHVDAANPKSIISGSTVWNDISRSVNNGIISGAAFNPINGGCLSFDGVNDSVNTTSNLGTSISGNQPKTFEVWVNMNGTGYTDQIYYSVGFFGGTSNGSAFEILLRYEVNGDFFFIFGHFVGSIPVIFMGNPLDGVFRNTWCMITLTYDGTTASIFRNGTSRTPNTSSGVRTLNTTNSQLNLGVPSLVSIPSLFRHLNGLISNAKVYNISLSQNQMIQNFNTTRSRFGV
jgi:hypothetical protein